MMQSTKVGMFDIRGSSHLVSKMNTNHFRSVPPHERYLTVNSEIFTYKSGASCRLRGPIEPTAEDISIKAICSKKKKMEDTATKIKYYIEANRKFAQTRHTPQKNNKMRAAVTNGGSGTVVCAFAASVSILRDISWTANNIMLTKFYHSVTCLDPRSVPEQFFGSDVPLAAIRNAGGRATKDAITSITVLRSLVNASTVLVVHHTGDYKTFY